MWSDLENQVYSNRTDLTPEAFQFLVMLTLRRRERVTAENLQELWERDQAEIAAFLRESCRSFQEEKP